MSKSFTSEGSTSVGSQSQGNPAELDEQELNSIETWLVSDVGLLREEGRYVTRPIGVGLSGARILGVMEAEELRSGRTGQEARRRGARIIDVGVKPIVPAFVNGHTHLALAPLRGVASLARRTTNVVTETFFRFEKHLSSADVRVFSRLAAFECALMGVGQVWDHYYFGEQVAEALCEVGLGGVVAPTLQDLSGPFSARSAEELLATLRIHSSDRLRDVGILAALGPHASDTVSDELLEKVAEIARQSNLPVHLHLAQAVEEVESGRERFERGLSEVVLDHLRGAKVVLAHGLYLSDAEVSALAALGSVLAYCPYSQLQFGFLGPLSAWLRGGGGWVLGTDCVASNDALDVQRELALAGGEAALRTSFCVERSAFAASGDVGLAKELERRRIILTESHDVGEPDRLLDALFGFHLEALTGVPSGICRGAFAHLLVLDPDHPALYPGDDLARTLAYGATSGAISFSVMAGAVRGASDGLRKALLDTELYRETLTEARRRRAELLSRVGMTAARPVS